MKRKINCLFVLNLNFVKTTYKFFFLGFIFLSIYGCARRGRIEGGPKDVTSPLLVTADPPYESVHFLKDRIKIYFDEYITLKDLNKQLVVSPPMKNPPIITPQGTASKHINIKILDTLLPNTTYIFNFGNAVQDNNEGNKLESFKYVFSTGNYIDSLKTKGKVNDALLQKTQKNINVLLYRIDSTFNDSIVYNKKPNYVTNTLDTTNFSFSNLKKGNYLVVALKEEINNYLFNPKIDKIGFLTDKIELPKDSILPLIITMFKEIQPYKFKKGKEVFKGKIIFGFTGNRENIKIKLLSKAPKNFKSKYIFEKEKDTINYWFSPFKADSLNFIIYNNKITDTVTVKLRKKKTDSLLVNPSIREVLHIKDTFFLKTNNPIIKIDTSKITLTDKDTINIKFRSLILKKENKVAILFNKSEKQHYKLKFSPKALEDIFSYKNDTLTYHFRTLEKDDYGKIILTINNEVSKHLIIELLTEKGGFVERKFISTSKTIEFPNLLPKKYIIRAIIDRNKNKKWDTGNYLKKILPEKVVYFPKIIPLRANYYEYETFIIKK